MIVYPGDVPPISATMPLSKQIRGFCPL